MSTAAPQLDLEALLSSAEEMDALPTTVARLATLVSDDTFEVEDIVEVVSMDQAFTATLLRRANSAASGLRSPVSTVREAAVMLGTGTLLSMALAASMSGLMNRALPAYGLAEGALWQQSVAASVTADVVRSRATASVPAEAGTAALLHDFGKVVLCQHFGPQVLDMLTRAADADDIDLLDAERAVFGVTHADIGSLVARSWRLPDTIVEAIAGHHDTAVGLPPVTAAVALAHAMVSDVLADPESEPAATLPALDEVMRGLGLDPVDYLDLLAAARTRYAQVAARYDVG